MATKNAAKEEKKVPSFSFVVSGDAKTGGFEIKSGRKTLRYTPGDEFIPPEDWQELPDLPDSPGGVRFSVPYELDTDDKEPVVSYRTVILPLNRVAVPAE